MGGGYYVLKKIIIIGAGDLGRELLWLIDDINKVIPTYEVAGFLDDNEKKIGTVLNGFKVLGANDMVYKLNIPAVIAIQSGVLRKKIAEKLQRDWLKKFDAYMAEDESYLSAEELKPGSFDFLVTSSVFEHLLGNQGDVEKIINLIKPDGVMALHTLICEEVPCDANWYYLLPVHCTMWTNKAMSIIFKKFNFKGCAYNVESRMWFMFRSVADFERLKAQVNDLKGTWQLDENFVDYWKVKPYRATE